MPPIVNVLHKKQFDKFRTIKAKSRLFTRMYSVTPFRGDSMLGFGSLEVALAYWACLAATTLCVVFGVLNWNKRGEPDKVKLKKFVLPKADSEKSA
jgi:hypothetical protein